MKYLLTIALLANSMFSYCQIHKFKAFKFYSCPSNDNAPVSEDSWYKVNFLVVVNLTADKITTYGEKEIDYDIIKYYEPSMDADGNTVVRYACVDEEGVKCAIRSVLFKDQSYPHVATLEIDYLNKNIYLKLKKDD